MPSQRQTRPGPPKASGKTLQSATFFKASRHRPGRAKAKPSGSLSQSTRDHSIRDSHIPQAPVKRYQVQSSGPRFPFLHAGTSAKAAVNPRTHSSSQSNASYRRPAHRPPKQSHSIPSRTPANFVKFRTCSRSRKLQNLPGKAKACSKTLQDCPENRCTEKRFRSNDPILQQLRSLLQPLTACIYRIPVGSDLV
jgi:hypothetical protein